LKEKMQAAQKRVEMNILPANRISTSLFGKQDVPPTKDE